MALEHEGDHRIDLDQVIGVMHRTGMDMQKAYFVLTALRYVV
jgi:L-serine deaminase